MNLKSELLAIAAALNESRTSYALCGGMAVVLHGYPRLTRDIDLLVREDDLDEVLAVIAKIGFTIPGGTIPFDVGKPYERRVYRVSKKIEKSVLTIDLILLPSYLEDVWDRRETYRVDGVEISAVSRDGLVKMKRIAGRSQDLNDIANLEGIDEP